MASVGRGNARGRKGIGCAGNKTPVRTPETRPAQLSFHTLTTLTAAAALLAFAPPVIAGPRGGEVVSGSAAITSAGAATTITQSSQKAIINWTGFSIGANESVTFAQPSYSAATLNRVTGNEKSVIDGALTANGQVFIVNSAGVLFGKSAQVNVGALVASTRDIANEDFLAGRYTFSGTSSGSVVNQGTISTRDGGFVSLLGKTVSNEGAITATLGTVALASGDKITLNFEGDALADITIDKGTLDALVANKQAIRADGGRVILSAKAADSLVAAQVNNTGIVQARTLADLTGGSSKKGSIKLLAQGGKTSVSGTLDASAPSGGDGGFIETSGDKVTIAGSAVITTAATAGLAGTWLVDPDGFIIGTGGDITGTALSAQLVNNNVTIASTQGSGTGGNIDVNDAVSWSANTLTLTATNNVNVNAVMTASGTASFAANYGTGNDVRGVPYGLYTYQGTTNGAFAGKINFAGSGGVTLNGTQYTIINDAAGLAAVGDNLAGHYVLGSDLTSLTSGNFTGNLGGTAGFTGTFNGLGHYIYPILTGTGVFGTVGTSGTVVNLGVTNSPSNPGTVTKSAIGLFANENNGTIVNSFASGTLNNQSVDTIGGFVGVNSGLIADSYSLAYVYAYKTAGGFVGRNEATGIIVGSSARASTASHRIRNLSGATAIEYLGGFVGVNAGTISASWSANRINVSDSTSKAGSFAGQNSGTIDQSYATNQTTSYNSSSHLAGFVWDNSGTITNAYTTSLYSSNASTNWDSGFVHKNTGTIANVYAYTTPFGTQQKYGFAYDNTGTLTNTYWYANTAYGIPAPTGIAGALELNSSSAQQWASYVGFDASIWGWSTIGDPVLRNISVFVSNSGVSYGTATSQSSSLALKVIGLQGGTIMGASDMVNQVVDYDDYSPLTVKTSGTYLDAGTWSAPSILSSSIYANIKGVVTVTPKTLTIAGVVADKTYDGTTTATLLTGVPNGGLVGLVDGQTLNISYTSAAFADKNAGAGKAVSLTYTFAEGTGKASNYTIATTTTATIARKQLTAAFEAQDKIYDGTTTATLSPSLSGIVGSDDVSLGYAGAFADANAGVGKAVVITGLSLTGADHANYTLGGGATATATATITPRALVLYGTKAPDGSATIDSSALQAMNVLPGDTVALSGHAALDSSAAGVRTLTDVSGLSVSNPNYTLVGYAGGAVVGTQGLALDHVAAGTADIARAGQTTTVTTSDKAIIDWYRFSVASDETLTFVQPASTSVVLNRVTGNEKSVIEGALNANGRVFILNSNGILFAAGSRVNAGAIVASTLAMTDEDFLAGRFVFTANGTAKGSIVADGDIVIVDGGFAALVSENGVAHDGITSARGGTVVLSAAKSLTLSLNEADNGLASHTVGGMSGYIDAAGTIDVSGGSGSGGFIETSGVAVNAWNLTAKTGTGGAWFWTQDAITVAQGGDISASLIENYLASQGNLTLKTLSGDIVVNEGLGWYKNTLTLASAKNVIVNDTITASGTASFAANWGTGKNTTGLYSGAPYGLYTTFGTTGTYSGKIDFAGTGSVTLQGAAYTVINNVADFNAIGDATNQPADLAKNYVLGSDLDFNGALVTMIGASSSAYTGAFNGFGHTLSNAVVSTKDVSQYGIFGSINGTVDNLGVVNATLTANTLNWSSGLLAGTSNGRIANSFATGSLSAATSGDLGGLVGQNTGLIANSYAEVNIAGQTVTRAAGLASLNSGTIVNSHSSGTVAISVPYANSSSFYFGGLVGLNSGSVSSSWSSVDIASSGSAKTTAGGLVGRAYGTSAISNSYATGNVTGWLAGGFIGELAGGTIANAYATGNASAANRIGTFTGGGSTTTYSCASDGGDFCGSAGGFAGKSTASIANAYAAGSVTAESGASAYGFVASGSGALTNVYWTANGSVTDSRATKLTAEQAKSLANYTGFESAYWSSSAEGHPILKTIPVTVTLNTATKTYGESYAASEFTYVGLQWGDTAAAFNYALSASELSYYGKLNAGVHEAAKVLASSGYTNIQGYVALNPKTVTVSGATVADKVYDGTTAATVSGGTLAGVEGEDVTAVFRSATYASKNAGTGIAVAFDYGFAYADGTETRNYVAASGTATGTITPKAISADYTVANREYDGTTDAAVTAAMLNGVVAGDVVNVASTSAFFTNKNAGSWSVTVNGTLSGGDAGNYTLATGTASATIAPRTVRLIGSTAYDGNTSVGASDLLVANAVAGDTVTLGGSVSIAGAANGLQTVADTSGLTLSQTGGNYMLVGATGTVWVHGAETTTLSGPSGGTVVSGAASITQTPAITNIAQFSDKAIIEWQRFSVPYTMVVNFDQPDASSVMLNRVIGNEPSVIAGAIKANGTVFIVNTAGVLFSATSVVNAGSLVASAQALANEKFSAGTFVFDGAGGGVSVDGHITVKDGGYVALVGGAITANGTIRAAGGDIVLASSDTTTLDPGTAGRLKSTGTLTGSVKAGGTLDASSVTGAGGRIATAAETVTIAQGGHVLAGGNGQAGLWTLVMKGDATVGTNVRAATLMETLASADVTLKSAEGNIVINEAFGWSKNTLSLDTTKDINVNTVVDIGGSANFAASYGASTFKGYGGGTPNYVMTPEYEITLHGFNMAYAKNADGSYADSFAGKINIGTSGSIWMGAQGALKQYTVINNAAGLDAIRNDIDTSPMPAGWPTTRIAGNYVLGSDIDLSSIADWSPIAASSAQFTGTLQGFGHVVANLTSSRGGLFGTIWAPAASNVFNPDGSTNGVKIIPDNGVVSNLGVTNVTINVIDQGVENIGAITGTQSNAATLKNVFSTGTIMAKQMVPAVSDYHNWGQVGGIAGDTTAYIDNSWSSVDITTIGYSRVGGFTGTLYGNVQNSFATGDVIATKSVLDSVIQAGGFAGNSSYSTIKNSYATGNVTGVEYVGGFIGSLVEGRVYSSYATGNVRMVDSQITETIQGMGIYEYLSRNGFVSYGAGGFVGNNTGVIANSSSSGRVSADSGHTELLGGFAGLTMPDEGAFSVFNAFNKDTAGIANDGRGNVIPSHNHGGGSGTPILDAVNQANGTHLTAAQFHGGAAALNTKDFGTVTAAQRSGNSVGAAQGLQNVLDGKTAAGGSVLDGKTAAGGSPLAGEAGRLGAVGVEVVAAEGATSPTPIKAEAGVQAVAAAAGPDVAASIEGAPSAASDEEERRRRQAAARASRSRAPNANYDARLKSIEVEGKRFDLEAKPDAGGANPQGAPVAPQGAPSAPAPKAP